MRIKSEHQFNQTYIMIKTKINYYRMRKICIYKFKKIVRSYVELENRLKALEDEAEKIPSLPNDSANEQFFFSENYSKPQNKLCHKQN